jgi:HAD superfamily phosphoserine phosphatase-like hydrolase
MTSVQKEFESKLRWNTVVLDRLKTHQHEGVRIVLVTGALAIYMETLREKLAFDDLIATDLVFDGDVCQGVFANGNMVRAAKGHAVRAYLEKFRSENTGTIHSIAFGNLPDDKEMLSAVDQGVVVTAQDISSFCLPS